MTIDTAAWKAWVHQAWEALACDPPQLRQALDALGQLPPHQRQLPPDAAAWLHMFEARACLAAGNRAGCEQALQQAENRLQGRPDLTVSAACCDLRVLLMIRDGHWVQAQQTLQTWLPQLASVDEAMVRYLLNSRKGLVCERQGLHEDALRAHYRAVAHARESNIGAALAFALGALGGLHSSLMNSEDALPLCQEAWALCGHTVWWGPIASTGPNLMLVLTGMGRDEEACAMADHLLARESNLVPMQRAQRYLAYAGAYARGGRPGQAQHCLDLALQEPGPPVQQRPEWVWVQASLCNQRGQHERALDLVLQYLAIEVQTAQGADYPIDAVNLHAQAALACETLQDWPRALHHQRLASAAREETLRRGGHARRLTLQIGHELALAHQQRDQALREQTRLSELNAQLDEVNRAKTRFLAAASHDLRQPLHALTLQAAALRQELQLPRQLELLTSMERCASSLTMLFDALLDLSRADSGQLQAQRQSVDLRQMLLSLIEEHQPLAQAQGLRLALRVSAGERTGVAPHAISDPRLLETLLRNLLTNAIKYTPQGTVLLCLRRGGHGGAQGAPGWRLQVRDSGVGIAAEHAPHVFEAFYQVGNSERRGPAGQGLGLAIVQQLATLLDHPLRLRSAPQQGTCVELRLQRSVPSDGASPALPVPESRVPALHLHVALIEDDPDVLQALQDLLQAWSCTTLTGISADDIQGQLERGGALPDAVLADLWLPGARDGAAEVLQLRLLLAHPALPALVMSADLGAATLRRLHEWRLPWLPKPAPVARLAQWLQGVAAARHEYNATPQESLAARGTVDDGRR